MLNLKRKKVILNFSCDVFTLSDNFENVAFKSCKIITGKNNMDSLVASGYLLNKKD